MTYWKEVDKETFYTAVAMIKYREQDVQEAVDFGCRSIRDCYDKANHDFIRWFLVFEGTSPVCTVALQRDGHIIFFIADNIKYKKRLVKVLRELAEMAVGCCGPIITKTIGWYKEALKFNRLIGFHPWKINDIYQLWVYGDPDWVEL